MPIVIILNNEDVEIQEEAEEMNTSFLSYFSNISEKDVWKLIGFVFVLGLISKASAEFQWFQWALDYRSIKLLGSINFILLVLSRKHTDKIRR